MMPSTCKSPKGHWEFIDTGDYIVLRLKDGNVTRMIRIPDWDIVADLGNTINLVLPREFMREVLPTGSKSWGDNND